MNTEAKTKNDSILQYDPTRPANDTRAQDFDSLVERAVSGDKASVAEICRTLGPRLLKAAEEVLDGRDGAEDVVQDLYVMLLDGTLRSPSKRAFQWLLARVRRMALRRRTEESID